MKKLILPLILILLLTFTLIGDCWVAGYDQRIKLTIDHTKIDDTLTNFPITTFFTAAQAEEIFTEFDADEDFDRGQFALGDDTLLKAEKELFDDSESKGLYHIKIPSISSSVDTDYYFYYDNDADHNTSYIGIIGSATAAEVWVDYAAVYHMTDAGYDIINACDATTDWTATNGTQSIDTSDKYSGSGSLKFVTDPAVEEGFVTYNPTGTWDWSSKTHLKVWMKGDTAESGQLFIFDVANNWEYWNFTYPTSWTLMEFDLSTPTGDDGTGCGDWSDINAFRFDINEAEKTARYDEVRIYPGTLIVQDSTSNNNDGTKKATNEPTEVTGKVGQAQGFDGTDDYISIGDMGRPTYFTIEHWITRTGSNDLTDGCTVFNRSADYTEWGIVAYAGVLKCYTSNGVDDSQLAVSTIGTTAFPIDTFKYVVVTVDGTNIKFYLDGALRDTVGQTIGMAGSGNNVSIGRYGNIDTQYWEGKEDEVRISYISRSAAWLKATYNTLWDSLLTYGSEERKEAGNALFWFNF